MPSAADRYRTLLEASSALVDQPTVEAVLHSLRSVLSSISCICSVELYLLTRDGKRLKLFAYDLDGDAIAVPIGTEVSCTHAFARAVETQKPVYLPDTAEEMLKVQELAPSASRVGVHPSYVFPVTTSRKQYGVVAFNGEQGRKFDNEDVELMGSIASHIAVAIENWMYEHELAEERDRLRASHDDLERTQAYLAEGQRLSHTGSWAFDLITNRYVHASEECLRIFGLDPQKALPTREVVYRRIHPEDSERVSRSFEKSVRENVDTSDEFRLVFPDGAVRTVQVIRHPVLNRAGNVVKLFGTAVDITERKRAEEGLRESETRFRVLFDHAADGFAVFDEQHKIVDVNREVCESLGYSREELIGMVPQAFDVDVDAARLQWIDDRIAGGEVCTFESRIRRKDGTVFPVEVHVRSLQFGGRRLQLASTRDISERKRADEERHQSAERFRAIADYTYDWETWIGVDGKLLWVNPAVERITGYSVDECMAMPDFPLPIVAETDRQTVASQMGQAVEGSSRNDFEFRVRHKNGHLGWVAASWQPIYDSQGARLGYRSSMRDIAERKRAEEALRRTTDYLAETQRLTHTGTFVADANTNPLYWSEEMFRIFGFDSLHGLPTRDEPLQRIHPEDIDKFRHAWQRAIHGKVDADVEYRIVLPDGTVKRVYGLGHPILNANAQLVEVVGTTVDITERKRNEEALRTSKAQLAHERDRLSLLLEINNLIISKLEVNELFQAIAEALRKHFGNDLTSLWLLNKETGCLERKYLDFPTGKGILEKIAVVVPTEVFEEWWRIGTPQFDSPAASPLPADLREAKIAESLSSSVVVPLLGVNGPLGALAMDSRKENAFNEADRDLLSQIGTQISLVLDNALAYGRLQASRDDLEEQRVYLESEISSEYNFEDIIGNSAAMKRVFQQIAIVASTDSTVLLHGETGTGKELIARAIHHLSPRRDRTFVRVNCAAIPSGLLESELFGHERGAFTGALMQKKGRFELADHGSLFLDEIGDISLELQPKLLRAVQEQEFERLGSANTIHVDVRMIAATHRNLSAMIRDSRFREDLFYRLNVFPIEIPPLRERRGDVPLLISYFVSKLSRRMGKKITSIPKQAMEILANALWPGNVRELQNFIERSVILTQGSELHIPIAELKNGMQSPQPTDVLTAVPTFQDAERQAIVEALKAASGKISGVGGAAQRLGLKRTTLQNKMRRLQIPRSEYSAQTDRREIPT